MKKIGLLFGSFNPLHNGHLALAEQAERAARLDDVWFVLQTNNVYKPQVEFMDYEVRKMLIEESGLSVYLPTTSDYRHFMTETLKELQKYDLTLILGVDLAADFPKWSDYAEITNLANIYTADRRIQGISSGLVRDRLAAGESIDRLVPPSVARFLQP